MGGLQQSDARVDYVVTKAECKTYKTSLLRR